MMEAGAPQISLSLFFKCFVSLRSFILVICSEKMRFIQQSTTFLCLFISLQNFIWLVITISPYLFIYLFFKILKQMLKDMKNSERCGVSLAY